MQCPNCGAEIINNKCDYCDTKISNYHSKNTPSIRPNYSNFSNSLAINGGNATGNIGQVNKLYDEEKFHAAQGHGYAAERANNLCDKATGHKAKIVGDNNALNGADRIVDGVMIQSKYCKTGKACINNCFQDGKFRYMVDGKPMQIEVPSDNYEEAIKAMEEKIKEGKMPGITNPNEAKNIIRKGHFTYSQAKNIAKAGTIESLSYDAANGIIISSSTFGITTIISLATNLWNGEDFEKSLKMATLSGLEVSGTAFVTTIISSQLEKAGLNYAMVESTEAIVKVLGPKASAVLVNAFRKSTQNGSNIHGAAAMKSAAKILRTNIITTGTTIVVLSFYDIIDILNGRISFKQLLLNFNQNVICKTSGSIGIIISGTIPGVGHIISIAISSAVTSTINLANTFIMEKLVTSDAQQMIKIIQCELEKLSIDYLLNQSEIDIIQNNLAEIIDGNIIKQMYASKCREEYACNLLIPIIEKETGKRNRLEKINTDQISENLKVILENIANTSNL